MGEADRCREGRVRQCDSVIGATVGSMGLVRLCDRCDGVARAGSAGSISGSTFFLSKEREIEQRRGWGWLGTAESREWEERCAKWNGRELLACFGKWFTEIFSVNRFPFFPSRFYGKKQTFSVWLLFYVATNVCKCWKRFTENVFSRNKLSLSDKICQKLKLSLWPIQEGIFMIISQD